MLIPQAVIYHGYPSALARLQMVSPSLGLLKSTRLLVAISRGSLSGMIAFTASGKQAQESESFIIPICLSLRRALKQELRTGREHTHSKNSKQQCGDAGPR